MQDLPASRAAWSPVMLMLVWFSISADAKNDALEQYSRLHIWIQMFVSEPIRKSSVIRLHHTRAFSFISHVLDGADSKRS